MGFFKNIQENIRMAKYLRMYDTLPQAVKLFFEEKEFVAEISKVWDLQKNYEDISWPPGWPFINVDKNPWLAEHIKWAKSEGATDRDIAWWWNLSPLERILIKGTDHAFRRLALVEFTNKGFKPIEIMKKTQQAFTIYTEFTPDISTMTPGDKEYHFSEDRFLPIELHDRVDVYLIYLKNNSDPNNLSRMQQEKESFSSANAWIRSLIKKGCL